MPLSPASKADHLLVVFIKEPIDGHVKKTLAQQVGEHEANLRYQALCGTLLEQFIGLSNTHIRFCVSPSDGTEAVQFWLLPQLQGRIQQLTNGGYLFQPEKAASSIEIDFVPATCPSIKENILEQQHQGLKEGFKTVSVMGSNCPNCGSRWLQMSIMLCMSGSDIVVGTSPQGGLYLSTVRQAHYLTEEATQGLTKLPELSKVKSTEDWQLALASPIGGKLMANLKRVSKQFS